MPKRQGVYGRNGPNEREVRFVRRPMGTGPLFDEPVRPVRREIVHAPPRLKTRGIQDIRQTADGNSPLIPTADPKKIL
ncbi:hypothetical protein HRbin30_03215 [bacterium HR30]|nr:hypothetical protein HRbin30_03215 [bacterium HR30]